MKANGGNHKTITHDFPVWREKSDFILVVHLDEPDVPKEWKWEQIWARQVGDNVFEVCCIPFVSYGLALGDLVDTESLEEKNYVIRKVLEKKGHTTYRVWFINLDRWHSVIENIKDLGCQVEVRWEKSKLIAIDAPTADVRNALDLYLSELESNEIVQFETGI